MVVAGSLSAILGPDPVPREGVVAPDVDTELRFFSVWYAIAGVALLRCIPQPGSHGPTIRLIAAGFFAAGCARVLSWISAGAPHALFVVLMAIELLLPLLIVPWQVRVARSEVESSK